MAARLALGALSSRQSFATPGLAWPWRASLSTEALSQI